MKFKHICFKAVTLIFIFTSVPASATVIFSSLPTTNTFNSPHLASHDENTGQAQSSPTDLNWAYQWTASLSATITSIDMALSLGDLFTTIDENVAQVFLHDDLAGLPGGIIDSYQFSNLVSEVLGGAVENGTSSLNPFVTAGSTYWISLSAGLPNNNLYSQVGWHLNDQGLMGGTYAHEDDNGGWSLAGTPVTLSAFRISGVSNVPEPTTIALLLLGLVGLGFTRCKTGAGQR